MVGVRGGKIDPHYLTGGIVPSLLEDPNEPQLMKSKKRCGLSGKPFLQSSLSTHEKDILGTTTFN
jgi:hypothetical protein